MTTTPAPAERRRVRPRARRAQLLESATTGLVPRAALAHQLGVSERTLTNWGIPSVKVGGLTYYRQETVRGWFAERERGR